MDSSECTLRIRQAIGLYFPTAASTLAAPNAMVSFSSRFVDRRSIQDRPKGPALRRPETWLKMQQVSRLWDS